MLMTEQERERLILDHQGLCKLIAWEVFRKLGGSSRGNLVMGDMIGWAQLGLVEAAARYKPGGRASFATFARYRIKGALLDRCRGPEYWASAGADQISEHLAADDAATNPLVAILAAEVRATVADLVTALPTTTRAVVRMRFWEDMSLTDIASALGVSVSRVSQIIDGAIPQMRDVAKSLGLEARHVMGDIPVCSDQRPTTPTMLPAGSRPWTRYHSTPIIPTGASGICRSVMRRAA